MYCLLPNMTLLATWNRMTWKITETICPCPISLTRNASACQLSHLETENQAKLPSMLLFCCLVAPPCGFRVWSESVNMIGPWSLSGVVLAWVHLWHLFHSHCVRALFPKEFTIGQREQWQLLLRPCLLNSWNHQKANFGLSFMLLRGKPTRDHLIHILKPKRKSLVLCSQCCTGNSPKSCRLQGL